MTSSASSAEHGFTSSWRSAEHGFESSWRSAEHGFTLVEMLVALVIFGLLAAAGTALLASSVDAQAVVAGRLDQSAALRRVHALAARDTAAALPRPSRGADGERPAFEGTGDRQLFALVRGGVGSGPGNDPRPAVRRVTWQFADGRILRSVAAGADTLQPGQPVELARNVAAAQIRYRSDGAWQDGWRPLTPELLPDAIEIAITFDDRRTAVIRLPMGPGV